MTIRVFILLCLCITSFHSMGQYPSDDGRFSVAEIVACAPYGDPIVINAPECDGTTTACSIDFDYGDGVPNTLALVDGDSFNYSYTEPGTYIIRIQFGTTGGFDQIALTILPNESPDFNIYTCSANRVQLDITDTNYTDYSIDYDSDGVPDATSPTGLVSPFHTYASSTSKTVTVRPNFINCSATSKAVTPVPGPFMPAPPTITELEVNANEIALNLNTASNFLYQLDVSMNSPTSWSKLQDVTASPALNLTSLDPENNFYCFRIGTVDVCDGASPVFTGSNTICSSLPNINVTNNEIAVSWNTSNVGVNAFTIQRTPGPVANASPAPPFLYADTDVVCGTTYSYRVVNEYGAEIRSISEVVTGTAISDRTPSVISDVTTAVNGNVVELNWIQDPAFSTEEYQVFRVVNGGTALDGTTPGPSYTAENFDTETETCFQIRYDDVCGNQSPISNTVCPIILNASLEKDNSVSLTWNDYNGWAGGISHYVVEKYDDTGQLVESIDVGNTTRFTDHSVDNSGQIFTYRVLAVASNLAQLPDPSISQMQRIIKNPNLSHPTAFIPQGDLPENRTFRVLGSFINSYQLKIFNRWGELMFESFDPENGWDGTYRGQRMPEGTYVFQARVTDFAGRSFDYAGTVVLLKKG